MPMRNCTTVLACLVAALACNKSPDIDKVPAGTEVQVTREDGGLVEGKLQQVSEQSVKVDTGRTSRVVPRKEIADVRVVTEDAKDDAPPARATFREILVPADTTVPIELASAASSETSRVEQPISGTVAEAIVIDGTPVIPRGSAVRGVVSRAVPAGKVKGRASLGLHFNELTVNGTTYPIDASFLRTADSEAASDAKKIGVPAIGGAVIGGIIGGKKGAAIGAAAGGGAGAAVVLSQPGKPVEVAESAVLRLSLGKNVDVRVPVH